MNLNPAMLRSQDCCTCCSLPNPPPHDMAQGLCRRGKIDVASHDLINYWGEGGLECL
jgi:hypothetical protein